MTEYERLNAYRDALTTYRRSESDYDKQQLKLAAEGILGLYVRGLSHFNEDVLGRVSRVWDENVRLTQSGTWHDCYGDSLRIDEEAYRGTP